MSQELVTYIILGSKARLSKVKYFKTDAHEQCVHLNYDKSIEKTLDSVITQSHGSLIVLLPPSSIPNSDSRDTLKKISLVNVSAWGWFKYNSKRKNLAIPVH